MNTTDRFLQYAQAFEEAYSSDDWTVIEPFFTEGAVYETVAEPPFAARHEGRPAVLRAFKESVESLDRRFASREVRLVEGPEERDGAVWMSWRATYRIEGAPDLILEGEERAWFEGNRIGRLEDRFAPGMTEQTIAYLESHGAKLRSPDSVLTRDKT